MIIIRNQKQLIIILFFIIQAIYQQLMNQIDGESYDFLSLKVQPKFQQLLEPKQELILSTNIFKYNSEGRCQQRILVVTNLAILNISKADNILKTFMKKFINFQNKYEIKRRISLSSLYAITLTQDRKSNVFLINVNNEHDYHYRAENNKLLIVKVISQQYRKATKNILPFYFREENQISNYCTSKYHLKEKKDFKPKQNSVFLNQDYFAQNQFQNDAFICEYSHKNEKIQPKNFKRVDVKNIKFNQKYFILKQELNRSIHVELLSKSEMLLNPYYTFYSEKKQLLFIPFMIGGNLKTFLSKFIPISQEDLIFYLAQILLFLQQFHTSGKIYSNITLQNILVKENGYLILKGLESSIQECQTNKLLYRVSGNPYYFPPQAIECRGYREQIDIWKLGVCAYILIKGDYPFRGSNLKLLYYNILNKPLQQNIPTFIKRMLDKNKNSRIKISQLLETEYFNKQSLNNIKNQTQKAPYLPDPTISQYQVRTVYQLTKQEKEEQ